jgi:hypothetical protein
MEEHIRPEPIYKNLRTAEIRQPALRFQTGTKPDFPVLFF